MKNVSDPIFKFLQGYFSSENIEEIKKSHFLGESLQHGFLEIFDLKSSNPNFVVGKMIIALGGTRIT